MEKFLDGKEFTFQRTREEKPAKARFVGFRACGNIVIEFLYDGAFMAANKPFWSMTTIRPDDTRIKVVKKKHVAWANVYQYSDGETAMVLYNTENDAIHFAEIISLNHTQMTIVKARHLEIEED